MTEPQPAGPVRAGPVIALVGRHQSSAVRLRSSSSVSRLARGECGATESLPYWVAGSRWRGRRPLACWLRSADEAWAWDADLQVPCSR